jgi:hypothetical protein
MIGKYSGNFSFGGKLLRWKLQSHQPKIREILFSVLRGHVNFTNLLNNLKFIPKHIKQFGRIVLHNIQTAAFLRPSHGKCSEDNVAADGHSAFHHIDVVPAVVAGQTLPALASVRVANTPTADGRIDLSFDALPVSQLPLNPNVSKSPNASNLAGAVAGTAITAPGTTLVGGSTVSAAVNTLTNQQLSGFNAVHTEPY